MQIIPVIDIQDGQVVHAKEGHREHYQPIRSPLCSDSKPLAVLNSFLALFPFSTIYLADLNSITSQGHNDALITDMVASYPEVTFWVDRGYREENFTINRPSNLIPVTGSESLHREQLDHLTSDTRPFVLSLDFLDSAGLGPEELFCHSEYWPENIIIMTLARVGSNSGPDFLKLNHYQNRYPGFNFIAAGGIRDRWDLERLKSSGFKQALVASALHTNKIACEDIRILAN
jgi:phosphoribosylformimino-5-aminoimidazole carboxamide ribotide isomerase